MNVKCAALFFTCQVEKDERLQPPAGQHLGLQRTRSRGLQGAGSSGLGAHREMVHGSRGPEDRYQREGSARDPLYTSRYTSPEKHVSYSYPPFVDLQRDWGLP